MNRIELVANELAMLSNHSVAELAAILVRDYPTRADVIETQIATAFQESNLVYNKEFTHG
jgi:hypothetical protein